MDRITYVEIAGSKYPLSFSLGASKAFAKKFGSIDKMGEVMRSAGDGVNMETLDAITYIMAVLIQQGVAYMNLFCKDLPPEKGVRIEDGKHVALTEEELDVAVDLNNAGDLIAAITGAMNTSGKTELEVQSKEKNGKAPEETD